MSDIDLVFLGSCAALQIPAFFCSCESCEAARANPELRRTRASVALIGKETVLIDAGPDLEYQLDREGIRRIDRIFITHWHFDHVWGLASLGEPSFIMRWPPLDVYVPEEVIYHFDQELAHMKDGLSIHPIKPGDTLMLPDTTLDVVKTTHNEESVGFVIKSSRKFAYLVDGIVPPLKTIARLDGLDLLILEATVDELVPGENEQWFNFSLKQAVDLWKQVGTKECILTHLSCHSWDAGKLVAGLSHAERLEYEARTPGLKFAYDGMRLKV